MTLIDIIATALAALRSNLLRTFLTMLGIIIGISAVIVLTAASEGAQQGVGDRIRGLGSNLMFIRPGAVTSGGVQGLPGSGPSLFLEDSNAIAAQNYPYIEGIAAQATAGGPGASLLPAQVIYRGQNVSTTLVGTEASYQSVRDFYVASGRFISDEDITKKALTTVLGANVAEKLFGDKDPIGESVRISVGPGRFSVGFNFTIVGVMEKKGASTTGDQDDLIFVPLPSFQARVPFIRNPRGYSNVSQINIKLTDRNKAGLAKEQITALLLQRHNVNEPDFSIQTQSELLATATDVEQSLQVLVVSIALISLAVGGLGIMNIMLVSVTERTREIGIRKAIGAKRVDILLQFLVEAIMVTLLGGLLGVAIGWAITRVLEHGIDWNLNLLVTHVSLSVNDSSRYMLTPFWIVVGLGVSAVTGLVAGVYPAWRASRLDPIEALRHE